MFIRIWAENIHQEKYISGHADTIEEAIKWAKSLLAVGYKKAWIEIQED